MSEYITIQVGQCGNQIGSEFWPLVLQEYGITREKSKSKPPEQSTTFNSFFQIHPDYKGESFNTIQDLVDSEVKARTILVDMETSVVSRYKNSYLRDIFDEEYIIVHYPGSGNNWAEGFCHYGPRFEEKILYSIRKAVENCDSLHGFLLMYSLGGGTGSGVGSYILKLLDDHFPHIDRFVTCVYPIGTEDVITCPYNMALATKELIEHASCVIPVENRALIDIVKKQASNTHSIDTMSFVAGCKPFQDMNSIIVNMLLNLTSGSRFTGDLNVDLSELVTNMVPFPNLPFLSCGLSPLTITSSNNKINLEEIFLQSSNLNNQLIKINASNNQLPLTLGTTLLARGDLFTISDMRSFVDRLQRKNCFTSWSKQAIKIGMCGVAPIGHRASMMTLFNTTAINGLLGKVKSDFTKLYQKRAHVHHYLQVAGFEEIFFEECLDVLCECIKSYQDIENRSMENIKVPRLIPEN
ncbi:tubulin epsilon chain-like [Onthophagus taurus]|uniref:tubulin epsilon chain-like n=1 Tax=Onthophagus taurus TaxID=166361 RepID=UPI000C204879|nr:tubulin epsilon chain-like [Onthophagus taurus]